MLGDTVDNTFKSIPFEPRELKATEEVLKRIYDAAKLGIKGDALAFAAGLLPIEYRRLLALDNAASIAEAKGRADSEVEAASVVRTAAMGGDSKAAMALLTHLHDWMPKQQINIDIKSQISITAALQEAESRVIQGRILQGEAVALEDHSAEPLALESERATANL
jgi:transcription elongation GreA/GreB family factor